MAKSLFAIEGEITSTVALTKNVEVVSSSVQDLLHALGQGLYVAFVHTSSALLMGYVRDGQWEGLSPLTDDASDYVQCRFFSDREEWLYQYIGDGQWQCRHICEGTGDMVAYLDSCSPFIGNRVEDDNEVPHFAHINESGRKVDRYLPTDLDDSHYGLRIRSYIIGNPCTGQAGFAFHRYVAIEALSQKGGM